MHFSWGWTESSISLELTKTGAPGEKLERNGSSVSHRVHASKETQQSCQGSTPHLSLRHLVPIWCIPSPPISFLCHTWSSEIILFATIHYRAAYSFSSLSPHSALCLYLIYSFTNLRLSIWPIKCFLSSEIYGSLAQRSAWCLEMSVQWPWDCFTRCH